MMTKVKYFILGTGVAGSHAADRLMELGQKSIMMIAKDVERPYDRPPLSKEFFKGEIPESKVYYHPATYYKKNNIELKLETEVISINPRKKYVVTDKKEKIGFEKLLIALGSKARKLPNIEDKPVNLYHLRRFVESRKLKKEAYKAKHIVILGSGFIGLELAAALSQKGIKVTIVSRGPYLWSNFVNEEAALIFEKIFNSYGVKFYFNDELDHFVYPEPRYYDRDKLRRRVGNPIKEVVTKNGIHLPTDLVIYAIGIILQNEKLLRKTGFKWNDGLVVDKYLKTNFADIYGAGDIINYPDPIFKVRRRVEHWGHAEYTGNLAAENMSGEQKPYDLLTYVFSDLYDMHLEFAGFEQGYDKIKILGNPNRRKFTALYLKKKVLRAYLQVNGPKKERGDLETKIRKGAKL